MLRGDGWHIIWMKEEKKRQFKGRTNKASPKELSLLCSQLHLMVSAGMNLSESLMVISEITKDPRIKKALTDAYMEIARGEQLYCGFLKNKDSFPAFFIHMLHFGEETGSLDTALKKMDVYFDKQGIIRDKLKSSMTYPAVVFVTSMIVIGALLTFIVPGFAVTLEELGGELPAITGMMLSMSSFIRGNFILLTFLFLASAAILARYTKSKRGKEKMDSLKFRTPFIRKIFRQSVLSDFCRNMSIMVSSGFNIIKALELCAEITENTMFRRQILDSASLIKKGGSIGHSFSVSGIDDRLFLSLVMTGEDTGAMENMLEKAAEYFEREVENLLERSLRLLEPAVIGVMALIIGTIIISVMLPIISIMDTI
ncbi:MAG TPA: type II secretion system F family protein [Clostridiaceae bacterium]